MKRSILILTSLSDTERNVAEAGLELAIQLHQNIIVLNCDDFISTVVYYPGLPVVKESLWREQRQVELDLLVNHLNLRAKESYPQQIKPRIKSLIMEGDLDSNVKKTLIKYPVELIVMGARSGSSTEHFLFGSETATITNHATVPVMVIPPKWNMSPLLLIIFATKFLQQDAAALQYIFNLRRQLGARLEIVHVRKYGKADLSTDSPLLEVIDKHRKSNSTMITYNKVFGKHIIPRLNRYCKENGAELLALSREQHSFLFRMVKEDTVAKYLSGHEIPLLIIPPLKNNHYTHIDPIASMSAIVL